MTSERPFAPAKTVDEALAELEKAERNQVRRDARAGSAAAIAGGKNDLGLIPS